MAKFKYSMSDKDAVVAVKKACSEKMAILKDAGNELVVGGPGVSVNVKFANGVVETSAKLFGKAMLGTVDTCIEFIDGFEKI